MRKPNITLLTLIALLVGCVAGASIVYFSMIRSAKESVLKQMTTIMSIEHLGHAQLLRKGKHDDVLSRLERTLPDTVRWYTAFGYKDPADIGILWRIREHCSQYGVSMPPDIQAILDSLPPKPPLVCSNVRDDFVEPSGPANGSQPIRSETNRTSSAAGSRR